MDALAGKESEAYMSDIDSWENHKIRLGKRPVGPSNRYLWKPKKPRTPFGLALTRILRKYNTFLKEVAQLMQLNPTVLYDYTIVDPAREKYPTLELIKELAKVVPFTEQDIKELIIAQEATPSNKGYRAIALPKRTNLGEAVKKLTDERGLTLHELNILMGEGSRHHFVYKPVDYERFELICYCLEVTEAERQELTKAWKKDLKECQ